MTRWLALLLTLAPLVAHGQVDVSQWPKVQLEIFVTGAKGDAITGLDASAIGVREDGKPQAVEALQTVSGPQSVCLLIDSSGSMYSRLSDVRAAANHLLDILPAGDEICLASVESTLYLDRHFTKDRAKIATGVQFLRAAGTTPLRDAVIGLEDYMRASAKNRQRAIVLFTDGADNASNADEVQMERLMESAGSPVVDIVRVPKQQNQTTYRSEETSEKRAAQRIAAISGGLSYFPGDAAEMNAALDDLNRSMQSVYILTYLSGDPVQDGSVRNIQIKVDKAHGGSKAVVWAPERFYAPSE